MLPVVALVGRPNVGKSTLFNRLTRTRDALVADFPGLTRDRKYGQAKYEGLQFIVVDTGGISGDERGIDVVMAEQSLLAILEADVVLFLVDARTGMTAADQGIAEQLRKQEKPVYVVANKVDGIDGDSESADFFALGLGDVNQIAAAHGRGVTQLLQNALAPIAAQYLYMHILEESDADLEDVASNDQVSRLQALFIKSAIDDNLAVSYSTLTIPMLGEERVVVYDEPGKTRDSIFIPMERDDREYILNDTAGVRRRRNISKAKMMT